MSRAKLTDHFDAILSADQVKALKPRHEPYALVARTFDVALTEVCLVAALHWDVAGALAAGCAAAFVARPGMHLSRFERPHIVGDDLIAVARKLSADPRQRAPGHYPRASNGRRHRRGGTRGACIRGHATGSARSPHLHSSRWSTVDLWPGRVFPAPACRGGAGRGAGWRAPLRVLLRCAHRAGRAAAAAVSRCSRRRPARESI